MKILMIPLALILSACGPESSPEGRSKIRDEKLQEQMDSLKYQNRAILDTLHQLKQEMKKLQ